MKLGQVVGRVTLNACLPQVEGGRWLIVSPMDQESLTSRNKEEVPTGSLPTPVVYDDLGGWNGNIIGYVEGREAAMPFEKPTPVDAYNCALIDTLDYRPQT